MRESLKKENNKEIKIKCCEVFLGNGFSVEVVLG